MWTLAADDQPHPCRPAREVEQAGDLGDPGARPDLAVGVIGRCPGRRRDPGELGLDRLEVAGQGEADRVGQPPAGEPVDQSVGAAGPVDPDEHVLARPWSGSWASAARRTVRWSSTVLEPAFPRRSRIVSGSPVPLAPWSRNAQSGWKPKPRLNVGAACSFSECEVTRVASTSMTSGLAASVSWSGACSSANDHAVRRAAARAALIAASAAGASAARGSISRDTVGSEATGPNTCGWARSWAISARQSPPRANEIARSSSTLPGSWRLNGRRHGDSAALNAASRPTVPAVRVSRTPPAPETTFLPCPSTARRG